ncbi:MAG TPA: hypothetical protein VF070_03850 [Streptosporangiaceae bacterium]
MNRSALPAVLVAGACILALASCSGQSTSKPPNAASTSATASPAPATSDSAASTFALTDQATPAKCPSGSPGSAGCFVITLAGTLAEYGTLRSGRWLDVEVPQSSPACGKSWTYTESLKTATGSLVVRATGSRLCLDVLTTVLRHYTVVHATGTLSHLHGSGTISLAVQSVGAAETWTPPR